MPTQLLDQRAPVDRAVLVGTPTPATPQTDADEHLRELGRLTDTAGGLVVGDLVQRLDAPRPRHYLGRGKAEALARLVDERDADLVIFDDELTPAQGKNLESLCGVRVMDRAELILDIFATRARSYEARLQVELAQLQYLLPRLRRMWIHLSRIRGGIGLRGPGETQLETDRRLIGARIAELRRKLAAVARTRATQRRGRSGRFRAVLVGYTNAGKSSLLQSLSGAKQFVEDRLFATLDAATRTVPVGGGRDALVTDTVGFIRKLPHHLVASFRSTLDEAREADLVLHVVDASHPDRESRREVVRGVLAELDLGDRPRVPVFNKIDALSADALLKLKAEARAPALFASALAPATLEPLRRELRARIESRLEEVRVVLDAADGKLLSELYREGEVLSRRQEGETLAVVARVTKAMAGRLRARGGARTS